MVFQDPYSSLNPRWRVDAIIAEPIKAFSRHASRQEAGEWVLTDPWGTALRLVERNS